MEKSNKSSYDTLLFLLALLERIPKGRKISAKELQEQLAGAGLNKSIRTIQRHLDKLTEQFSDLERDARNKPYGYSWKKNSAGFCITKLSDQEALLLVLAQEYLKNILPINLLKSLDGLLYQANTYLRQTNNSKSNAWRNKICIIPDFQPLIPAKIDQSILEEVSTSLYQDKYLDIVYINAENETVTGRVKPLALAQHSYRMYLVCIFDGFSEPRQLALNRLKKAKMCGLDFIRPKDFSLKRYIEQDAFSISRERIIELSFKMSNAQVKYLEETPLSKNQEITTISNEASLVRVEITDTYMLDRWLNSFADDVWDVQKLVRE